MQIGTATKKVVRSDIDWPVIWKRVLYYKYLYILVIPVLIYYFIFAYLPMYGVTLAFKSFNYSKGILGSPWIGFQNFVQVLSDYGFWRAFKNTLVLFFLSLIIGGTTTLTLTMMINEMALPKLKKLFQTIYTFPHFISWIIISGIVINILRNDGVFNQLVVLFGGEKMSLLTTESTFRPVLYISNIWKEIGWSTIIYLAAIAGINPELYQSAEIDGANRFQRIIHITWPGIRSTFTILLILGMGSLMGGGLSFDQIFNLYSAPVYNVADTVDTYIFRTTFTTGADFGYMTCLGLIRSIISLGMVLSANIVVKKLGESGIF